MRARDYATLDTSLAYRGTISHHHFCQFNKGYCRFPTQTRDANGIGDKELIFGRETWSNLHVRPPIEIDERETCLYPLLDGMAHTGAYHSLEHIILCHQSRYAIGSIARKSPSFNPIHAPHL